MLRETLIVCDLRQSNLQLIVGRRLYATASMPTRKQMLTAIPLFAVLAGTQPEHFTPVNLRCGIGASDAEVPVRDRYTG